MGVPRWKGNQDSVIKVLVSENPKKLGSKTRERFYRYCTGMTVREYVEACKSAPRPKDALLDITWDSDHRFIEILETGTRLFP